MSDDLPVTKAIYGEKSTTFYEQHSPEWRRYLDGRLDQLVGDVATMRNALADHIAREAISSDRNSRQMAAMAVLVVMIATMVSALMLNAFGNKVLIDALGRLDAVWFFVFGLLSLLSLAELFPLVSERIRLVRQSILGVTKP